MPDGSAVSDGEWADYVFHRQGEPAVKREWWYHVPSGVWFIAERDNVKDEFVRSYLFADMPKRASGNTSGGEGASRG